MMINDVIFNGEISAFYDWNIVLTKSEIEFPAPKTSTVDIKGADGVLDLSEALTGEVKYSNRTIDLTFELLDDADYTSLISKIGAYVHGQRITVQLTNDPLYYYTGRAYIDSWDCVKRKGKIVITIECEPYKYRIDETIINVDVFNETKTVILTNERQRVYPTLSVQGNVTMRWNDTEYELSDGVYRLLTFYLVKGDNVVKLNGDGSVRFTYRMGAL